jgi:hypothetical protein
MDFHMRRGDPRFHDMFLQRAAGSVLSSSLLQNGGFFGSRNATPPDASRIYGLLHRRQPTMQTFDFKNYSSIRYQKPKPPKNTYTQLLITLRSHKTLIS